MAGLTRTDELTLRWRWQLQRQRDSSVDQWMWSEWLYDFAYNQRAYMPRRTRCMLCTLVAVVTRPAVRKNLTTSYIQQTHHSSHVWMSIKNLWEGSKMSGQFFTYCNVHTHTKLNLTENFKWKGLKRKNVNSFKRKLKTHLLTLRLIEFYS